MKRFDFGFPTSKCLRLQRVEEILRDVVEPVPSRDTLVNLILEGTLEGGKASFGYFVYEVSFIAWVRSFQPQAVRDNAKPKLRLAAGR